MRILRWTGKEGEVTEVPARLCCWCAMPHWLTEADRVRNEAGAPTSHGLCERASERMMADVEAMGNGESA
jgi:hypothetical protein